MTGKGNRLGHLYMDNSGMENIGLNLDIKLEGHIFSKQPVKIKKGQIKLTP